MKNSYAEFQEDLRSALMVAGEMLAHHVEAASEGEIHRPLVALFGARNEQPRMVWPRSESEDHVAHISAGRIFISEEKVHAFCWVYVFDEHIGSSGRAVFVEIGFRNQDVDTTFVQKYWPCEDEERFMLVGDLELIGGPVFQAKGQGKSSTWDYVKYLSESAANAKTSGLVWSEKYSSRFLGQFSLLLGEFEFAAPKGWSFRQADGGGWILMRLVPWDRNRFESTIGVFLVEYPDHQSLNDVVEDKGKDLANRNIAIVDSDVLQGPLVDPLSTTMEFDGLAWFEERDENRRKVEWICGAPRAGNPFLALYSCSFQRDDDQMVAQSLRAVLQSFKVQES